MFSEMIHSPELSKYRTGFQKGQILFMEEDLSQDLYILVSGHLEILKGNNKIMEITEPGAFFGEMSFLLGAKRTATVKALNAVQTLRIPQDDISVFFQHFPAVTSEITKILAQRLDATSQVLYGLKEFCDKLPDAMIVIDREGRITTWNSAAETLFGRTWPEMHQVKLQEICVAEKEYQDLLKEAQIKFKVAERVLRIQHPEKGVRYLSTSISALYDHQHHFQGLIAISRDVTAVRVLEQRYRKVFFWSIPAVVLLILAAVGIFWTYPYLSRGLQSFSLQQQELQDRLGRDYLLLQSLLAQDFAQGRQAQTNRILQEYFKASKNSALPYTGILLLDNNKRVFDAWVLAGGTEASPLIGSTYAAIEFHGYEDSPHRVLTLYRAGELHSTGAKQIEVAFQIKKDKQALGWLVFQMDQKRLAEVYRLDETDLKKFHFIEP